MARYYEENALIEFIKQHTPTINGETTMECVERAIRNAPTADVVECIHITEDMLKNCHCDPVGEQGENGLTLMLEHDRELARKIFEDLELLMKIYTFPVVKSGVIEIVKEPFWCIEPNDFETLKKKYTEGEHDE